MSKKKEEETWKSAEIILPTRARAVHYQASSFGRIKDWKGNILPIDNYTKGYPWVRFFELSKVGCMVQV